MVIKWNGVELTWARLEGTVKLYRKTSVIFAVCEVVNVAGEVCRFGVNKTVEVVEQKSTVSHRQF